MDIFYHHYLSQSFKLTITYATQQRKNEHKGCFPCSSDLVPLDPEIMGLSPTGVTCKFPGLVCGSMHKTGSNKFKAV
jgi:hypothetical protein